MVRLHLLSICLYTSCLVISGEPQVDALVEKYSEVWKEAKIGNAVIGSPQCFVSVVSSGSNEFTKTSLEKRGLDSVSISNWFHELAKQKKWALLPTPAEGDPLAITYPELVMKCELTLDPKSERFIGLAEIEFRELVLVLRGRPIKAVATTWTVAEVLNGSTTKELAGQLMSAIAKEFEKQKKMDDAFKALGEPKNKTNAR